MLPHEGKPCHSERHEVKRLRRTPEHTLYGLRDMFQSRHSTQRALSRWFIAIALLMVNVSVASPRGADPLGDGFWERLGTEEGVVLKRKKIKGTKLFAVRGEATIDSPISRVASVLCDHTRWVEWTQSMTEAKLLSKGADGEKIVYQAFKMPAIIANRDVVYAFKLMKRDGYIEFNGASRPGLPSHPTNGVRMNLVVGRWFLKPIDELRTHLILEVLMDPRGYLPSWFVNIVQRDYPVDTLTALRRQAKKSDIQALPLPLTSCR